MSEEYVVESADGERGTRMLVVEDATLPIPEESPAEIVHPHEAAFAEAIAEAQAEETAELGDAMPEGEVSEVDGDLANAVDSEGEADTVPHVLTDEEAESILEQAVGKMEDEVEEKESVVMDFAKNMHKDLLRAVNEVDVCGINEGYYSRPAFKTKFGMIVTDQINSLKFYAFSTNWTDTFLAYAYSETQDKNFLEVLFNSKKYAKLENKIVNDSIRESSFYKEDDPFSIRRPLRDSDHRQSIVTFYLIPDVDSGFSEFLSQHSDAFNVMANLSKREMDSSIDVIYFEKILPEIAFTSEVFEPSEEITKASRIAKKFVFRKVKNNASGTEFYSITGDRTKIAAISSIFKNVLADDSIKFQQSYRYLAREFIGNNWWHPCINEVLAKDNGKIPNPEKIFTPNLIKASEEKYAAAMEQITRIRRELIPEDSVLALTSPFIFERPENGSPFKSARHEESDMTFLPEFLTENFLVPNMSTSSINSDGNHGLPEREIVNAISCGLMTDDILNSSRKLLEFPDLPSNATIILKDLELK